MKVLLHLIAHLGVLGGAPGVGLLEVTLVILSNSSVLLGSFGGAPGVTGGHFTCKFVFV